MMIILSSKRYSTWVRRFYVIFCVFKRVEAVVYYYLFIGRRQSAISILNVYNIIVRYFPHTWENICICFIFLLLYNCLGVLQLLYSFASFRVAKFHFIRRDFTRGDRRSEFCR